MHNTVLRPAWAVGEVLVMGTEADVCKIYAPEGI